MTTQQGQQLVGLWLSQGQRLLEDISNDLHGQELKELISQVFLWIQRQIETLHYNLTSLNFSPRYIYQLLGDLFTLEGKHHIYEINLIIFILLKSIKPNFNN